MDENRDRRLTLSDAMALVAAIAFALAISARQAEYYADDVRRVLLHYDRLITEAIRGPDPAGRAAYLRDQRVRDLFRVTMLLKYAVNVPLPFLVFLSPALLGLRCRRPRPGWRDLIRQPGAVACAGGVLTSALAPALGVLVGGRLFVASFGIVPLAWLALAASGRWLPEPSGIDRLGRAVGWGWMAAAAYAFLYLWAGPFGGP